MNQESRKGKWERFKRWLGKEWWKLGLVIAALAVAAGAVAGIFKPFETLNLYMFILALVTILAAVIGLSLYLALSERLRGEAERSAFMESQRAIAHMYASRGFFLWEDYEEQKKKKKKPSKYDYRSLNRAIRLTMEADSDYASSLDEQDRRYQSLICDIRNNLAAYLAIRKRDKGLVEKGDGELAHAYIKYILNKIEDYPGKAAEWADTAKEVESQFPTKRC